MSHFVIILDWKIRMPITIMREPTDFSQAEKKFLMKQSNEIDYYTS